MSLLKFVIIISLFSFGSAQADIYKCVIKGKTTFSQQPCASDAVKVEVNTYQPTDEQKARAKQANQSNRDFSDSSDRKYKILHLKQKRAQLKKDIKQYQTNMDVEMNALKQKKNSASNNLAGATWEDSISSEMIAIPKMYQTKIDNSNNEIERINNEIAELEAK